ncbi:reverse transcriptase domain-containing protein [Tanacetum coccineum]
MIVRSVSPYNGIIGRPGIREIQAVPSIAHEMLKFPADGGIVTIRSTILIPAECATVITSLKEIPKEAGVRRENLKVAIHPNFPDQEVAIGGTLSLEGRTKLSTLLKKKLDIFAWQPSDMTGVPRSIAKHRINIREGYSRLNRRKGVRPPRIAPMLSQAGNGRNVLGVHDYPEGIKLCPDKTEAVLQLSSPRTIKEGPELNYTPMEKLVLSLVFAAKRLRRYFQAHPIAVITDQPIKQIISRPDVAGRLQKWSVMLGEHNITYRPRTSVKGQILADFLVEKPDENPPDTSAVETPPEPWTLFTDGSSCVDGSGAEYEALIAGLRIAAQMGVRNIQVSVDSKLVANQVLGTYVAKEENMIKYLEKVKSLVSGFANFSISQIPRSKNKKADALSKIASTSFAHLSKQVLVEVLTEKSIQEKEVTTVVEEEGTTWMTPIVEYLKDGTLPGDRKEASKLRIKARQYELMEGILYRRSFLKPWLSLGEGIKARLGEGNKNWLEKLPHVLWAHRTMIKSSHGDTPFSLTYSMEAVIPAEIGMPTYRTTMVDVVHNDEELQLNLDLLEEKQECAAICEAKAKMKMTKYYNARVRDVDFRPRDFVYRSNDASHAAAGGKLRPKWEGPYEVTEALGDIAYKLQTMDSTDLSRTWNIANLNKCYL